MVDLKRFLVPWIDQVRPYSTDDLLVAWSRPELKRMMINENPIPPSEKVIQAVTEAARLGNRYPDNGPRIRAKIAKQNVQVFKPAIDTRYTTEAVTSHNGLGVDAVPVPAMHRVRTGSERLAAPAPVRCIARILPVHHIRSDRKDRLCVHRVAIGWILPQLAHECADHPAIRCTRTDHHSFSEAVTYPGDQKVSFKIRRSQGHNIHTGDNLLKPVLVIPGYRTAVGSDFTPWIDFQEIFLPSIRFVLSNILQGEGKAVQICRLNGVKIDDGKMLVSRPY
jgi:hypothetical protein